MSADDVVRARVIRDIPASRIDPAQWDGTSLPRIGDIVELDQAFTGDDGEPMVMAYCHDADGRLLWYADLYEAELELVEDEGG